MIKMRYTKYLVSLAAFGLSLCLSGCATQASQPAVAAANTPPAPPNIDPYEKFNRAMYSFNDTLDHWVLRPVAKGYDTITPPFIHKGIDNFFDNLALLISFPNDFLQAKFAFAAIDFWRFLINSTVGIGGFADPATYLGLEMRRQDFGLTLAYWSGLDGFKPQPYLMVPFLGPSTVRDTFGKVPDSLCWPFFYIDPWYLTYIVYGAKVVDERANLLAADQLVQQAFDPYIFIRSAYLQNRQKAIENSWKETHPNYVPPETSTDLDEEAYSPVEADTNTTATPEPTTTTPAPKTKTNPTHTH
jgi:phospholipid-binding lipoprotein MlaA